MWFVLGATVFAVIAFVRERLPLEVTSAALLSALLLFGQFFPVLDEKTGQNLLAAQPLLAGFANPSLIAVLALLVMGQAMIHTDALRVVTSALIVRQKQLAWVSIIGLFVFVMVVSAFMNNTPLVIITIPIMQALAYSVGLSESRVMIPLSYIAILGGMTTLVGSSTNLLVSSTMMDLGYEPLKFFDFTVPGAILAGIGFLYVILIVPRFLKDRTSMAKELMGGGEKEFVAELDIAEDSKLIGMECVNGQFPEFKDMTVKLIQRGGHLILPPFEGYRIDSGDVLIVSATRQALTDLLSKYPGFLLSEEEAEIMGRDESELEGGSFSGPESHVLANIMITPASRMIDMSLEHINFHKQFSAIVLGIQRRARVVRRRMGRIRLEAGDVLLVAGKMSTINALRDNPDFIVLSGSKRDLPLPRKAPIAAAVFITAIALAALNVMSIPVAAISGAVGMILTGCLNIRQATRSIDRKIFLLVGSMLALGWALQVTGGAQFIAGLIMGLPFGHSAFLMLATLFILVAFCTNILTNNACAILFTPIALDLADHVTLPHEMAGIGMQYLFAITVIFAANCSFASPIGYQTNLLVMGPGNYRFSDFLRVGIPLVLLLWGTYMALVWFYFGVTL